MANDLELFDYDLYVNGTVITYDTGEVLLDRVPLDYTSQDPDRWHTVLFGDRLTAIAHRYYSAVTENAGKYWKYIADANDDIENPLDLDGLVGTDILIPDFQSMQLLE